MGGVTSFDVTVSDNLETCFQVRNGPFNTTKRHTHECIHRPHLLEPAFHRVVCTSSKGENKDNKDWRLEMELAFCPFLPQVNLSL